MNANPNGCYLELPMSNPLLPTKQAQPAWTAPMLATLTKHYFSDPNWIFECKLDGMRCLLQKKGQQVTIYSRNKKKQNECFPELVAALEKLPGNFILDSEVVTFKGKVTSFEALQARMHVQNPSAQLIKQVPIVAFVFDILHLNGYNLCNLPLMARKEILLKSFKFKKPLSHLEYRVEQGEKFLKQACKDHWEGLIAKRADSKYEHKRSKNWLKFKCALGQELVIGGYTAPQGARANFGALLLGYYKDGEFKYAGKVGTGFNSDLLDLIYNKMRKITRTSSPFVDYNPKSKSITWLQPKLVAEVRFTEWTSQGSLRHPSFIGLREDKSARSVTRD